MFRWRTRTQSLRTVSELPICVDFRVREPRPRYQEIASKALELRGLGHSDAAIAERFGVNGKTVAKAIRWLRGTG